MSEDILYEVADGIGRITLNRPQSRNALTFAMYERIGKICADPAGHGAPRVLLMTGAGDKAFGAGTDIAQFRAFKSAQDALAYEQRIEKVIADIERCTIPTIAAIAGAVTGGGAAIACACDLRVATADARFGFPVARTLGNCLSVANYGRLVQLLGPARVKDVVFTARFVGAQEGLAAGLYNEVVADHAALMARADELARTVAANAPLTLRATKEALRRIAEKAVEGIEDHDLIEMCYTSADFREGMEAFLAKRPPNWQGR